MAIDEILEILDQATLPEKMSKEKAVEFLRELCEDILTRINELEDEIEELK